MNNKQVASIMERIILSDGHYFFKFDRAVVGSYDEKTQVFTDVYGKKYHYMMTEKALTMKESHTVFNMINVEDIKKKAENKNKKLEDLISEYIDKVEKRCYIIGYTDKDTPYLEAINLDIIKREATTKEKNMANEKTTLTNIDKLEQLILDTVDGKYSKEELQHMIEVLENTDDVIENVIGTMETQIEAMDNNKSFKEYLTEQLSKPEGVVAQKKLPTMEKKDTTRDIAKKVAEERKKETERKENLVVNQPIKTKLKLYDMEDVYKKVTETLIGQDEPTRRVLTEMLKKEMEPSLKRQGILLTGATGTGKTEMMRQFEKYLNKPLIVVDTGQLTMEGYVGQNIEKYLYDLYLKCGKDIKKAENAIVCFDEIDKKGSEKHDDVSGRGVINLLLKFIEGTTYDAAPTNKSTSVISIDTTNMTTVFLGAFTDVYNHSATNNIGFDTNPQPNKFHVPSLEDFEKYGMMPREFLGRVLHVPLNPLGLNELKRVLLESKESAIKSQETLFRKLGVRVIFTDEFINKVAKISYLNKTGARGLNDTVNAATWQAYSKVYVDVFNGLHSYKEVIFSEDSIEDSSNYQLTKRIVNKNKK